VAHDDRPPGGVERTAVLARTRVLDGKYRLGRLIGEGGMGAVYEARHEGLQASVAVKLLSEHGSLDTKAVTRFRREARAMGAIRHENVVAVMDTGTDEYGVPFLVMELLEGESLAAVLRREHALSPGLACWIASQLLSGLGAAHARGVIHRDLKPGNVFLARLSDGSHRVKVLDFGISKLGGESSTLDVTAEGSVVGTPNFMAPEQITGEAPADARTDLYAVGVLLYRMVTGTLPYIGRTSEELYQRVLVGGADSPRRHNPEVPPQLEAVILRALEVDRARRFQDASSFRAALLEIAASVPSELPTATDGLPAPHSIPGTDPSARGPARMPPSMSASVAAGPAVSEDDATIGLRGPRRAPPATETAKAIHARRPGRLLLFLGLGGLLVLILAAGGVWMAQRDDAAAPGGPLLRFGIVQYTSPEQVKAAHQPTLAHLGRQLDRPVELVLAADDKDLLRLLFDGEVDLAALSPYTYVRAVRRRSPGLVLLAKPVTPAGPSYQGLILTRADSGIRSLGSLVGKRFCYVSPSSTSGYLYPRALLRKSGLDPDRSFASISFGQEHLNTLRLLDRGACDAAAVFSGALEQGERAGMQRARFHQLIATDRIPYDAYVVLAGTAEDQVRAITGALLALEPGSELAKRVFDRSTGDIIGFAGAVDGDYDPVRQIEKFMTGEEWRE